MKYTIDRDDIPKALMAVLIGIIVSFFTHGKHRDLGPATWAQMRALLLDWLPLLAVAAAFFAFKCLRRSQ